MTKPTLIIMAGGTGGHVFPGLSVATHMRDKGWHIEWIGTRDKMEAQLVPKYGFPIHFINIAGVRGKSVLTKLLTPFKLASALFQTIRILRQQNVSAVLGMGGYASGPGGIAAWLLRIPLIIHEQNAVFGMTNRLLSKVAIYSLSGFNLGADISADSSAKQLPSNLRYVGNPIREGFFSIPMQAEHKDNMPVNILIIGGSLGALALNQQLPGILMTLAQSTNIHVKHQAGKDKQAQVYADYKNMPQAEVFEFIDDMVSAFSWSDIIICRAGALTVAEVAGAGRTALFVPLPIAVDDHQTANAKFLSDKGAAVLIPQAQLKQDLLNHLRELCASQHLRHDIATKAKACANADATEKVAAAIEEVSHKNLTHSPKQSTTKGQL